MKCRNREGTSRAPRMASAVALVATLLAFARPGGGAEDKPIVPRDAAARPYEAGRSAVLRGEYAAGIQLLEKALATGWRNPEDRMGASRYFVERYDPDYWLGRAQMELGNDARAREHLERSRAGKLIAGWPEYADLAARLAILDQREAARRAAAAPTPTLPPPTATPSPIPAPTPPALLPPPELVPSPALPGLGSSGTAQPTPIPGLDRLVRAIGDGDMAAAESALAAARRGAPDARQLDLLESLVAGTRYVLGGGKDDSLLLRARASLGAFRAKGGAKQAEELWLSPGLLALLGRR